MKICEDELITRIKCGESIASIRKWFVQEIMKAKASFDDLTPFEQAFFNQICYAFQEWERQKEEAANEPNN
jgi:hypothetical protein